jgi:hypothetical protein
VAFHGERESPLPAPSARAAPAAGSAPSADMARYRAEARAIHRTLFGRDAPERLQQQYARAIAPSPLADWPRLDLERLLERGVDLEALELALRRSHRVNALTQRFHVVCYLAEAQPENFARFINERRHPLTGWLILGWHGLRSLYKLHKGRRLMQIHGLR